MLLNGSNKKSKKEMITVNAKVINALTAKPVAATITITDQAGKNPIRQNGHVISRRAAPDGRFILPVIAPDRVFVTFSAPGYKPLTLPADSAATKTEFKLYDMSVSGTILDDVPIISQAVDRIFPETAQDPAKRRGLTIGLAVAGALLLALGIYLLIKKAKA